MRLMIKQRVLALSDTYDVYDQGGNPKYFVKSEMLSLFHKIHISDIYGNEIGLIKQKFALFCPRFEIYIRGQYVGCIKKEFTFLTPKYDIDYRGWHCEGNFLQWNYYVYSGTYTVASINKELFHWGDTYTVDIFDPQDEIVALMLVIAIDAVNCSNGK